MASATHNPTGNCNIVMKSVSLAPRLTSISRPAASGADSLPRTRQQHDEHPRHGSGRHPQVDNARQDFAVNEQVLVACSIERLNGKRSPRVEDRNDNKQRREMRKQIRGRRQTEQPVPDAPLPPAVPQPDVHRQQNQRKDQLGRGKPQAVARHDRQRPKVTVVGPPSRRQQYPAQHAAGHQRHERPPGQTSPQFRGRRLPAPLRASQTRRRPAARPWRRRSTTGARLRGSPLAVRTPLTSHPLRSRDSHQHAACSAGARDWFRSTAPPLAGSLLPALGAVAGAVDRQGLYPNQPGKAVQGPPGLVDTTQPLGQLLGRQQVLVGHRSAGLPRRTVDGHFAT